MSVSKFENDNIILYYQMPGGLNMVGLEFPQADDNCAQFPPECDGQDYWNIFDIGCLEVHQVTLPVKDLYRPLEFHDSVGFTMTENQMSSELQVFMTQPVYFLETQVQRTMDLKMPF